MKAWGCPHCGSTESRVRDTGHDEDGYVVRLRRCMNCDRYWATEERPISVANFWLRNASKRRAHKAWEHEKTRACQICGVDYKVGWYRMHVFKSNAHERKLAKTDRNRVQARRIGREWARFARNGRKGAQNGPKRAETGHNPV